MPTSPKERILKLAARQIVRPRDLDERDLPRSMLASMVETGELIRTGRGTYISPDLELSEHHALAEVSKRIPHAAICLLSALQFHELTLDLPRATWIAVKRGSRIPNPHDLKLRVYQFSEPAFSHGLETHKIEGVSVRITTPAKTIADCFKFRRDVGTTVAYQALKQAWENDAVTADALVAAAKVCRVYRLMRPYLDTLS